MIVSEAGQIFTRKFVPLPIPISIQVYFRRRIKMTLPDQPQLEQGYTADQKRIQHLTQNISNMRNLNQLLVEETTKLDDLIMLQYPQVNIDIQKSFIAGIKAAIDVLDFT
jgi:hypothetical protein